jgi:8-oxo-dGTP diphosphatase
MTALTAAVAAVITDPAGRVLLCQQRQGHQLWALPGGTIRPDESPVHAVVRDVRTCTGTETDIVDLVGLYQLTGDGCGDDLPDVLVHVFRGRLADADVALNAPDRIARLAWHDPAYLPEPTTATARAAVADAVSGRSGVLRDVQRDADPASAEDADGSAIPAQQASVLTIS